MKCAIDFLFSPLQNTLNYNSKNYYSNNVTQESERNVNFFLQF